VSLSNGMTAVIDDVDRSLIDGIRWHVQINKSGVMYAVTYSLGRKKIYMHRRLLGLTDSAIHVDHIDGNGLNNVRANIRVCNHAENSRNQSIRVNNSSGFKGIWKHQKGKWQAKIVKEGRSFHLGTFESPEAAQAAYANASAMIHGEYGVQH